MPHLWGAKTAVVTREPFRHPEFQSLLRRIPRGQREQHRNRASLCALGGQGQQQADQQHRLPASRVTEDHKAACRHPFQEHLGDLPACPGQFSRPSGPAGGRSRPAGRPVPGHLPQEGPRLAESRIGCLPGDRERIGVVQPPHPGLRLPLAPHGHCQPIGDLGHAVPVGCLPPIGPEGCPGQVQAAYGRKQSRYRLCHPQVETDGNAHGPGHAANCQHEIEHTNPPCPPASPHGRIFQRQEREACGNSGSAPRTSDRLPASPGDFAVVGAPTSALPVSERLVLLRGAVER